MELMAITGILATAAVLVLVIRQPWRAPGVRLAVMWLFIGRPGQHAASTRTPQRVWDDGPVPPIGSMDLDAELEYRAMVGLTPREPPPDTLPAELRAAGPELDASGAAQRASWAEPRPAVLLLRGGGPARPADGPGRAPRPPGPAERTDGASAPPGAWRGQYGALAPPGPPFPLTDAGETQFRDWLPRALPPWATEGGTWRIPPGVYDNPAEAWAAAEPEPPGALLEPLPPGGDQLPANDADMDANVDGLGLAYRRDGLDIADPDPPGTVVIGPGADVPGCPCSACAHDGCWGCPCHDDDEPEPEPPALACAVDHGGQPCPGYPEPAEPSRLADPGELFRAELASEVLADMRARDADTARYLDGQAADLATTLNVMIRGY